MADDVTLPGTGEVVAADEIAGRKYQRVKPSFGVDGSAVDVSETNPLPVAGYGELVETLEAIRMSLHSLTRTIGNAYPDANNRLRVAIDAITGALTLATITTVGTVTTVSTVTTLSNQTQIGGINAAPQIPAFMGLQVDTLRRNIQVT